jgi:hypothetical protein
MSMKFRIGRAAAEQLFAKLISGTTIHITSAVSLPGKSYTQADITGVFTDALNAYKAVDAARADLESKLQDKTAKVQAALALEAVLRAYVTGVYGKTSPVLLDFGWSVAKAVTKTVASKAMAVAKSLATREARHTMGKNQKAKIHGVVPVASASTGSAPVVTVTTGSASGTSQNGGSSTTGH